MFNWSSHDETGPLIDVGNVSFSAKAANLPGDKHTFEAPVFMVASEESEVVVEYNGMRLLGFGTFNDFCGFGLSAPTALRETQVSIDMLDGINADIMVLTKVMLTPCLISEDRPFYAGSQRVHYIPMNWSHSTPEINSTEQDFVPWKNGYPTDDAGRLYDHICELVEADAAPSRNGELSNIIKGKKASSRSDFLSMIIPPNPAS